MTCLVWRERPWNVISVLSSATRITSTTFVTRGVSSIESIYILLHFDFLSSSNLPHFPTTHPHGLVTPIQFQHQWQQFFLHTARHAKPRPQTVCWTESRHRSSIKRNQTWNAGSVGRNFSIWLSFFFLAIELLLTCLCSLVGEEGRPRGRDRLRWRDGIKKDMRHFNLWGRD